MSSAGGFTLLELVLVLTIVGLIAAVAAPQLGSTDPAAADVAAAEVARALRFTRAEALRTGTPHGVRLQPDLERLQAFRLDTATTPPTVIYDVIDPLNKRPYTLDLATNSATARVDLTSTATTFSSTCVPGDLIAFDHNGVPRCTDPMTSRLTAATIALVHRRASRTITVTPYSGRVSAP